MCQKINLAMLLDSLINSETLCLHVVSPLVEASYNIQHLIISLNQKVTVARCPSMFSITGIWNVKTWFAVVCSLPVSWVFGKRLEDLSLGDTLVLLIAVKRDLVLQSWMLQSHFSILIGESSKQNKEVNNFLVWDISHSEIQSGYLLTIFWKIVSTHSRYLKYNLDSNCSRYEAGEYRSCVRCLHTNRKQKVTESDDYISDAAPTLPECSCVLNSAGARLNDFITCSRLLLKKPVTNNSLEPLFFCHGA